MTKVKATDDAPAERDYVPTKQEAQAAGRVLARRMKAPPSPKYKVTYVEGKPEIDPDHPDEVCGHVLLADLFATGDSVLTQCLLVQLANVAQSDDELSTTDLNTMLATVKAIAPRDPTEALLACQMAAIHKATMAAARRLNRANLLPQHDSAGNMLNKLSRTFAAQLETLKRYRSTGEQSIRVQHVTVNEGGQAIVGPVTTGGGGQQKREHQPHEPEAEGRAAPAIGAAMPGLVETLAPALPGSCREGLDCVPLSRRPGRGTEGKR